MAEILKSLPIKSGCLINCPLLINSFPGLAEVDGLEDAEEAVLVEGRRRRRVGQAGNGAGHRGRHCTEGTRGVPVSDNNACGSKASLNSLIGGGASSYE